MTSFPSTSRCARTRLAHHHLLQLCLETDNDFGNSKFCVMNMLRDEHCDKFKARRKVQLPPVNAAQAVQASHSMREVCALWSLAARCDAETARLAARRAELQCQTCACNWPQNQRAAAADSAEAEMVAKRPRVDGSRVTMALKYQRRDFAAMNPKQYVSRYCQMHKIEEPSYAVATADAAGKYYVATCRRALTQRRRMSRAAASRARSTRRRCPRLARSWPNRRPPWSC